MRAMKLLTICAGLTITAACGGQAAHGAGSRPEGPVTVLHASRATNYASLDELATASTMIVVGTAGSSHVENLGGVDFTVTDVTITDPTSSSPSQIEVRQTGTAGDLTDPSELSPILSRGKQYLLYLQPFELQKGQPTGEYVIVGDEGVWEAGDSGAYQLTVTQTGLPETVKVSDSPNGIVVIPGQ